ncbi:G-type lectin S-receptor-like serine/threonine-protein kinase SD2-2 isoform X1 [Ipomoea triloba]|uniref:G-type lectin S-receptor-like serine/threonine-protein kinase SD2-2 isoform X1 n=1 Tax=Ipomoea triloba TaxID=35885 RepID=UPI00125D23F3|nr:G-type lectin S-receptor-like serine/threonine-protein kinase SD2-2 isoform X1 [Ipomoea triloba]
MPPKILLLLLALSISVHPNASFEPPNQKHQSSGKTLFPKLLPADRASEGGSIKVQSLQGPRVVLRGNDQIWSAEKTFALGFFGVNGGHKWYLGIWYASIPTPNYVWVANRDTPIKNLSRASLEITQNGKLAVIDNGDSRTLVWETNNQGKGSEVKLLEQGNLVFLDGEGKVVWQSFDSPTDTLLPGMNLTAQRWLSCWKSSIDPSPGMFSLRLLPPDYSELALVYNHTYTYWSSGNWTGNAFSGVPEMTIHYIYKFYFAQPFTPMASFGYSEVSLEPGAQPPLTRFRVDSAGQLWQYTWASQTQNWNSFWSRPDNQCRVYGLCGNLGFCNTRPFSSPCQCLVGFRPGDNVSWNAGDFSHGCRPENNYRCGENEGFKDVGMLSYDGAKTVSFMGSRSMCEKKCLVNCSCIGFHHNGRTNLCRNLYGSLLNLRNITSNSITGDRLYLRANGEGISKNHRKKKLVVIGASCAILIFLLGGLLFLFLWRRKGRRTEEEEEEAVFPVMNLKVFSYKELHTATKGFSEKLGHGGYGSVFRGELSDSSVVAVKRLDRPGGGENEFRAEVCTIGYIQHVNLVRLRGFCSENSHRLLVYDYMPNGSLSVYLRKDSQNLSWDARFRVAVGVARGIAYLHEGCQNCILHCDIKPENILLDEDLSAKVSDFGLAKLLGRDFSRVLATMRGTWGYVAPEWISGLAITTKADVYSYGMTLFELIGGRRNVQGAPSIDRGDGEGRGAEEKWFFPPWAARKILEGNISAVIDERLQGTYDVGEAERVGLVAVWCIQDEESMRPAMGVVVKMLEGVVEIGVPPPPRRLQALVQGDGIESGGGMEMLSIDSRDSFSFP